MSVEDKCECVEDKCECVEDKCECVEDKCAVGGTTQLILQCDRIDFVV